MKALNIILIITISFLTGNSVMAVNTETNISQPASPLDFVMDSIDGEPINLNSYRGQVILMVNVASKCGMTPQYEQLQTIYEKYKEQGFVILGFPANNFLWQEPGTNEEIKQFCSINYNVTFPMFSKISVKGDDQHPLYRFLTSDETNPEFSGKIGWNFTKFLISRDGKVINRFSSKTKPDDLSVITAIEKALIN